MPYLLEFSDSSCLVYVTKFAILFPGTKTSKTSVAKLKKKKAYSLLKLHSNAGWNAYHSRDPGWWRLFQHVLAQSLQQREGKDRYQNLKSPARSEPHQFTFHWSKQITWTPLSSSEQKSICSLHVWKQNQDFFNSSIDYHTVTVLLIVLCRLCKLVEPWKIWGRDRVGNAFFPPNMALKVYLVLSRSVMSDSLWPHGLQGKLTRLLCPWGFSRQEHWSGLPFPPPRDLPNPGIEPRAPTQQADSLLSELPENYLL